MPLLDELQLIGQQRLMQLLGKSLGEGEADCELGEGETLFVAATVEEGVCEKQTQTMFGKEPEHYQVPPTLGEPLAVQRARCCQSWTS